MRDGHGAFRTVRRAAFAAVLVLASAALAGSPGDLEWAEIASTASSGSEGRAVATFSDGSFVVTGKLSGNPYDLWVVRYDSNRHVLWSFRTNPTNANTDEGNGVAALPGGACLVAGHIANQFYLARHEADGTRVWTRSNPGPTAPATAVTAFADGEAVVAGWFTSSRTFGAGEPAATTLVSAGIWDAFLLRYRPDGSLVWARRAGGAEGDKANGVAGFADGSSVVTGMFEGTAVFGAGEPGETSLVSAGQNDVFVARYAADGSLAWARRAGGAGNDFGFGVAVLADQSIVVTGEFRKAADFGGGGASTTLVAAGSLAANLPDGFVARYDGAGTMLSTHRFGSASGHSDRGAGVAAQSDGSFVVTGSFSGTADFTGSGGTTATLDSAGGTPDIFLAVYDVASRIVLARRAGSALDPSLPPDESGVGVAALPGGSTIVTGHSTKGAVFGEGEAGETTFAAAGWFVAEYDTLVATVAPPVGAIVQECEEGVEGATVHFVFDVVPGTADLLRVHDVTGDRTLLEVADPVEQQYGVGPVVFTHGASMVLIELLDGMEVLASATVAVQVEDTTPPVLLGCEPQTVELQGPLTTLTMTLLGVTVEDACDPAPAVTFEPDALPLGTTSVTATARDATGNLASCVFDVTVADTTPPVFLVEPTDVERHCEDIGTLVSFDVLAEDLSGTVSVECEDQDGRTVDPSGTLFQVGEHTVTCTAMDGSGNSATCAFLVTVFDDEAPVLVLPEDLTVPTAPGQSFAFVEFTVTATDECDPDADVVCEAPWGPVQSGDAFPVGATPVTCRAQDHAGNEVTGVFHVTVQDREPPVLAGPDHVDLAAESCEACECGEDHDRPTPRCKRKRRRCWAPCEGGLLPVSADLLGATATDNCDPEPTVVVSPAAVGPGTTEVLVTAADDDGNRSERTVLVTVLKGPFECRFLRPLDGNVDNKIRPGRTVPVRIKVLCGNRFVEGATARVESVVQVDGAGTPVANDGDEDDADLVPDEGYLMRERGNHYVYHLRTRDWPATRGARFEVTIRVTKAGHADTLCKVFLKNR